MLEVVLALGIVRHLWRSRRRFPWAIALAAFFLLRGLDRVTVVALDRQPAPLGIAVDGLLVAVLAVLLLTIERVARGLDLALDEARLQEGEYRRALADYRTLVRHRLANPITAIIGGVGTLKELSREDRRLRDELLDLIHSEARRLEAVSLDPRDALGPEERGLRPRPDLGAGAGGAAHAGPRPAARAPGAAIRG
jgi:signal transduction histidine kinase